ncbi:MAG: hypothetical protein [Circular genetic element sp.]|jgi:hypothetical protein|nr:MAG: hypothetical protein [Circular genetic element sp.]|tara:strand:- start:138 stop:650 length:513 start_codon:yes stop_codon:yes gene_type:complete
MARSDSFFIRAQVNAGNTNAFAQVAVDLGAYVDALGKSVLRIHNIAPTFTDSSGASATLVADDSAAAQFQLTTQTQTSLITGLNKSMISSGMINAVNQEAGNSIASVVSESFDNAPQLWTNGYLVAVDTIYLGGQASAGFFEDVYVTLVMECTVETMTQAAAMALSLSQQ